MPKISIKKPRMMRRRDTQRWGLAQPAVNGSESKSISHSGLTFGNSGQQPKKQNVLAVRRYPLIAMPRLYKQMLEEN